MFYLEFFFLKNRSDILAYVILMLDLLKRCILPVHIFTGFTNSNGWNNCNYVLVVIKDFLDTTHSESTSIYCMYESVPVVQLIKNQLKNWK